MKLTLTEWRVALALITCQPCTLADVAQIIAPHILECIVYYIECRVQLSTHFKPCEGVYRRRRPSSVSVGVA